MRSATDKELENVPEADLTQAAEIHWATVYNLRDAVITELSQKYLPLKIEGVEDKDGYAVVKAARMQIKNLRVAVEKTRVSMNEDLLAEQRANNAEAKRLTLLLKPIETHLEMEEAKVDAENDRIKAEKQKAKEARIQGRIDAVNAVGGVVDLAQFALMSDDEFTEHLRKATEAHAANEARKAQEEADRLAKQAEEEKRLEALRAEQTKEQARLDAEKAENDRKAADLKAQQDAIDAQKRELEQKAREEEIRKDAEAKAAAEAKRKIDEEAARIERERVEAEERRQAEAAQAAAIEAAKPDAEKLLGFASFLEGKAAPELVTDAGIAARALVQVELKRLCAFIRSKAAALVETSAPAAKPAPITSKSREVLI